MDYIQLETNVDVEKYATVIENIRVYSDLENANMIVWGNYLENNQKRVSSQIQIPTKSLV